MLLLYNGKIYCGNEFKESILIDSEFIKEVGSTESLLKKYPDVEKIDLSKRLVLPGFNDAHMHLVGYGFTKRGLRLYNATSVSEVISLGKEYLKKHQGILIARGYNDAIFVENRPLNRYDLDLISTEVPVVCYRVCGHIVSVNTKALEMANIKASMAVNGGTVDVDKDNKLTGILRENAMSLLGCLLTNHSREEIKDAIIAAVYDANKTGITSISTNDIHYNVEEGVELVDIYQELIAEKLLNVRLNLQVTFDNINELKNFLDKSKVNDPYLRIGALKIFVDGSLGAKTAYMRNNYLNENHNGILCINAELLKELVVYANNVNLPVVIHAIGDQGIEICLDVFQEVGKSDLRNGIIHVQITDSGLLKRFESQRVSAIVQPIFINNDMDIVEDRIGIHLTKTSYAFKTLINNTLTCFSSDAPVEDLNPLLSIYSSVTRANLAYNKFYNLDQKTTVKEAIDAYTINSAYMSFEEIKKGIIKENYYSDLVVLESDIFTIEEQDIKDVKVFMTITGGKIVYQKGK